MSQPDNRQARSAATLCAECGGVLPGHDVPAERPHHPLCCCVSSIDTGYSESAARTTYRVSSFIEVGFPRWGTKKLWRVDAGPPYYKEVAGPFTSHREALDALAELVNAAFPSKVMTGGDRG